MAAAGTGAYGKAAHGSAKGAAAAAAAKAWITGIPVRVVLPAARACQFGLVLRAATLRGQPADRNYCVIHCMFLTLAMRLLTSTVLVML